VAWRPRRLSVCRYGKFRGRGDGLAGNGEFLLENARSSVFFSIAQIRCAPGSHCAGPWSALRLGQRS
jgi:hypothetical protein